MAISFDVNGQKLQPSSDVFIAARALNYPELIFVFDDEWTGFNKVATFCTSNSDLYYIPIQADKCTIPNEVLIDNEIVTIGVYGVKDNVRITTNAVNIMCHKSGYGKGVSPGEQSVDLMTQIQRYISDINVELATKQTATDVKKIVSYYIRYAISALYPEYTVNRFTEQVETDADKTMTCTVGLDIYNPDKYDGLIVTADGVLISPLAYTTAVENDAAVIRFGASAGLQIGQTVNFTVYRKPQGDSTSILSGETMLIVEGSTATTISGTAEEVTKNGTE